MQLSGPIRADLVSFCNKRILLLSDCHLPGRGCDQETNLAGEMISLMEQNGNDFLLLIEGSQDVESDRTDLDLVKFSRDIEMYKIPNNVLVHKTDIRRYSLQDDFWMETFLEEYSEQVKACQHLDEFLELLSHYKSQGNDKICKLVINVIQLILDHEDMYSYLDRRYVQCRNDPLQLTSWLMDCYALNFIYGPNPFVIYYCGELHSNNLLNFFRDYENARVQTYRSKFLEYCDRNGCQTPGQHLEYSLSQENSRCLILDVNLNEFFS